MQLDAADTGQLLVNCSWRDTPRPLCNQHTQAACSAFCVQGSSVCLQQSVTSLLLLCVFDLKMSLSVCRWYDRQGQVLVFITELLTDGSLRRFIRRKHAAGITLSALKRYAWQILQGLVYLHGHYPPIIHRCVGVWGCGTLC